MAGMLIGVFPHWSQASPTWKEYHKNHKINVYMIKWEDIRTRELWKKLLKNKIGLSYQTWKDKYGSSSEYQVATQSSQSISLGKYNGSHEAMWLCIHGYEGSWTDPDPPYFGGLQMSYGFMEAYGGSLYAEKGTADNWTSDEQIGVAENAWAINGYYLGWLYSQWPISGPNCT
jgi:hypothetical protein